MSCHGIGRKFHLIVYDLSGLWNQTIYHSRTSYANLRVKHISFCSSHVQAISHNYECFLSLAGASFKLEKWTLFSSVVWWRHERIGFHRMIQKNKRWPGWKPRNFFSQTLGTSLVEEKTEDLRESSIGWQIFHVTNLHMYSLKLE